MRLRSVPVIKQREGARLVELRPSALLEERLHGLRLGGTLSPHLSLTLARIERLELLQSIRITFSELLQIPEISDDSGTVFTVRRAVRLLEQNVLVLAAVTVLHYGDIHALLLRGRASMLDLFHVEHSWSTRRSQTMFHVEHQSFFAIRS